MCGGIVCVYTHPCARSLLGELPAHSVHVEVRGPSGVGPQLSTLLKIKCFSRCLSQARTQELLVILLPQPAISPWGCTQIPYTSATSVH